LALTERGWDGPFDVQYKHDGEWITALTVDRARGLRA